MKNTDPRGMTPYGWVDRYGLLEKLFCLHLQEISVETRGLHIPPKSLGVSTKLYGVSYQNLILTLKPTITSDLLNSCRCDVDKS